METGKVEYAPDYKSESTALSANDEWIRNTTPRQDPNMTDQFKGMEVRAECQRLRDAVVEAAKAERAAEKAYHFRTVMSNWKQSVETREAREHAVDALIAFEAEHKIGE